MPSLVTTSDQSDASLMVENSVALPAVTLKILPSGRVAASTAPSGAIAIDVTASAPVSA